MSTPTGIWFNAKALMAFDISPLADGSGTRVMVSTGLKNRRAVESLIGTLLLQSVHREELDLPAELAEAQASSRRSAPADEAQASLHWIHFRLRHIL